jgi:hypothetical protein
LDPLGSQLRAELENSYRAYDTLILSVASGILGLTTVFFDREANGRHLVILLFASWSLLFVSIGSVAMSLIAEQAHKRYLISVRDVGDARADELDKRTKWWNWSAAGCLAAGVLMLVVFLGLNVKGSAWL